MLDRASVLLVHTYRSLFNSIRQAVLGILFDKRFGWHGRCHCEKYCEDGESFHNCAVDVKMLKDLVSDRYRVIEFILCAQRALYILSLPIMYVMVKDASTTRSFARSISSHKLLRPHFLLYAVIVLRTGSA